MVYDSGGRGPEGAAVPDWMPTESVATPSADSRRVVGYLLWPESDEYIAVMDVLETSVTDLSAADVTGMLAAAGQALDVRTVEARLDKLVDAGAVSARSDTSRARRYVELLARNWRYTASPTGRQVQRFYRTVLAGTPTVREIPIGSLNRVVTQLETLAATLGSGPAGLSRIDSAHIDAVGAVFTSHDDLDTALVGAEDALTGLADRFDLDDEATGELKGLLVDYASRVAAELDTGSARAAAALSLLEPWFGALTQAAVAASEARDLIAAGALTASRGGRAEDWDGLVNWFAPGTGRAARFALRLVRTLPSMHANLRRLHSSAGTASSRTRALALARAVLTDDIGIQIFQAATGDHPWRKLYGEADEDDAGRNPSWRGGPQIPVATLLRTVGRSGARGRGAAPRDDRTARAEVAAARARRAAAHAAAVSAVLRAAPGQELSEEAARVALAALMAAARATPSGAKRTGAAGGLACSLIHTGSGIGVLAAPTWAVLLPGRIPVFHLPGARPAELAMTALGTVTPTTDRGGPVRLHRASDSVSDTLSGLAATVNEPADHRADDVIDTSAATGHSAARLGEGAA